MEIGNCSKLNDRGSRHLMAGRNPNIARPVRRPCLQRPVRRPCRGLLKRIMSSPRMSTQPHHESNVQQQESTHCPPVRTKKNSQATQQQSSISWWRRRSRNSGRSIHRVADVETLWCYSLHMDRSNYLHFLRSPMQSLQKAGLQSTYDVPS
jgi:hypothetical protein